VYAIVSDIHGNLEALQAVQEDIRRQGISDVICLGDTVGYGPNPKECIDAARQFRVSLLGNHDEAALFEDRASRFNVKAREAIEWTRRLLEDPADSANNGKRWDYLGELPYRHKFGDVLFVHGTPRDPTCEYLFPRDEYRRDKMEGIFKMIDRVCFLGHTHIPGIWTEDMEYWSPAAVQHHYHLDGRKTIVNVGSVGQPRDDNPDACYVIVDDEEVSFRRVAYPVDRAVAKIMSIPELHRYLGDRLRVGR